MESSDAIELLGALAHERRLAVFRLLVEAGPTGMAAGAIARRFEMPANSLSSQLAILADAGLVESRREGRSIIYVANAAAVGALVTYLLSACCGGRPEACAAVVPLLKATTSSKRKKGGCSPCS